MVPARRTLIAGVLLLGLLAGAGYLFVLHLRGSDTTGALLRVAPDFQLRDLEGKLVKLSDSEGTVRVINFWASWSPYSAGELAVLDGLATERKGEVTVLALCRDTVMSEGVQFLKRLTLSDPSFVVFDPDDTYYAELGGYNMPETAVLGRDGTILYQVRGPFDIEQLRTAIEEGSKR